MPGYVVDRAAELLNTDAKALNGAKVLLLGVTYKNDIADQRESARPARSPASCCSAARCSATTTRSWTAGRSTARDIRARGLTGRRRPT